MECEMFVERLAPLGPGVQADHPAFLLGLTLRDTVLDLLSCSTLLTTSSPQLNLLIRV